MTNYPQHPDRIFKRHNAKLDYLIAAACGVALGFVIGFFI